MSSIVLLHLETSTKVCSVAISVNGKLVALEEIQEDGYAHGEKLTLLIQTCLKKSGWQMNDLNAVSIASGPGSYTGLRIGTATAKGLCYALKIPLLAVDSLTSLIQIAKMRHEGKTLCALIDARRMEVYSKIESADGQTLKKISADIIENDSYREYEPFIYFGDGAEKLADIWSENNCQIDVQVLSSAKGQCALAFEKFRQNDFEDLAYFEPYYLKDFIAGVKKKGPLE